MHIRQHRFASDKLVLNFFKNTCIISKFRYWFYIRHIRILLKDRIPFRSSCCNIFTCIFTAYQYVLSSRDFPRALQFIHNSQLPDPCGVQAKGKGFFIDYSLVTNPDIFISNPLDNFIIFVGFYCQCMVKRALKDPGKPINKGFPGFLQLFILYDESLVVRIYSGYHYKLNNIYIHIVCTILFYQNFFGQ